MKTTKTSFRKPYMLLFLLLPLLLNTTTFCQDIIYTKKKGEIKSKVVEIGTNEIKYKNYDNLEGPVIVIRRTDVRKIQYQNGTEDIIIPDKYSANRNEQILDKQNAIKIHPFSPLNGHLAISYERVLKPGFNLETKVGIIGAGAQPFRDDKAIGGFVKIGTKFLLGQDFAIDGMRMFHPLKGAYAAFQLAFSHFFEDNYITTNSFAFNIIFGKQWILGKMFTLDGHAGIGYGVVSRTSSNPYMSTSHYSWYNSHFSHYYFGKDFPMTFTSGLSIGYLFK